ncbi:hypothetical protein KTU62_11335, partial [Escherichia coli]
GTRELHYGPHQWRGDFQFNISRYSQQQLMETSHRHLLHAEEGLLPFHSRLFLICCFKNK